MKVLEGPTGTIIPQLKEKHNVDTLDFVFLDHAKDQYTPDTKLLEVKFLKHIRLLFVKPNSHKYIFTSVLVPCVEDP